MIRFENRRQEIWTFPKHSNLNIIYDLKKNHLWMSVFLWTSKLKSRRIFVPFISLRLRHMRDANATADSTRNYPSFCASWVRVSKLKTQNSRLGIHQYSVGPNLSISMHMQTHCSVVNSPAIHLSEISVFISWMLNLHKLRYAYARNCVKTCCR